MDTLAAGMYPANPACTQSLDETGLAATVKPAHSSREMETSRRAMLTGMAVAPIVASLGAIPLPAETADRSGWEAILARHHAAWERLDQHPVHEMLQTDPGYEQAHADEMAIIKELSAATASIRVAPAPDFSAVVRKLQFHLHVSDDEDGLVEAAIADIRRLAQERRSHG